jgi:hypothetical protein
VVPRCSGNRDGRRHSEDSSLTSLQLWLCCGLLPLMFGCAAMAGKPQAEAPRAETRAAAPKAKATSIPRKKVPGPKDWGPELNMKHWHIQCSDADLAMLCRNPDRTDRRCAVKRPGKKYRWTYGHYCKRALPCYRKACN